jgi:hypothetical protein
MKQYVRVTSLFIVFSLVVGISYGQVFDSVLRKLDTQFPQEKLYLQFDKSAYNPGETIWFKAYLLSSNYPSDISHTIYAELVNEDGKVIEKKNAPVFRYGAASSFELPTDLSGSAVYVRAYTRWMLNFDSSFLFVKGFPLIGAKKKNAKAVSPQQGYALQFFPEGGDLVETVPSRVAFKGTDQKGYPIPVTGEIQDSKAKVVAEFKSVHDGMGFFRFTPQPGEEYKSKWKDVKGQSHETILPAIMKDGATIETNSVESGIQFIVRRPATQQTDNQYQLVAQMQQQLVYRAKVNLSAKTEVSAILPIENLASGILQLTLFTNDGKPVAERIVFVNKQDYYFITDLNAAVKNFSPRAKNVLQINVPDTIIGNLSVAVTDADINPAIIDDDDIFSSVLLTSDIKGYVHHPAYYFASEADSVSAHLDLVMMTNGWRRFKWEEVLAGHWPSIKFKPDNYLAIEGSVRGLNKNDLKTRDISAILQPKNGGKQIVSIPIEQDGRFELPDLLFFDSLKLFYQLNDDKDKVLTSRANFDFSSNLMREFVSVPIPRSDDLYILRPDSITMMKSRLAAQKYLDQQRKVQTLAAVEVTAKQKSAKQKLEEKYTSGLFSGDGNTFVPDDDPSALGAQDVFTYLQGKVAGLQISTAGGQVSLTWRGGSPSLFLDEMQQQDPSLLQSTPMSNVALIKVFRPPFMGAMGGGSGGAIAVYTKKGGASNQDIKGLDFVNISGYSPIKEFYSPDYEMDPAVDKNDYRTTLYWNPYVLTDKANRKIMLTFFNNDVTKKIRVVIEGMNADGKLTRMEKIFQ